ncbi:MAG: hypothetical protein VB835_09985 [Pirellulales bacterium]
MARQAATESRHRLGKAAQWALRISILLTAIGALAYFAPWIVSKTGLRNQLAAEFLSGLRTDIGRAELSWFAPLRFYNAQLSDADGNRLLQAKSASIEATLFDVLFGGQDNLKLTIENPQLFLSMRSDGSNIEDALERLLSGDGDGSPISIDITDGSILIADVGGTVSGSASDVNFVFKYRPAQSQPIAIQATANVGLGGEKETTGRLAFDFAAAEADTVVRVSTQSMPLAPLAPILRRFTRDLNLEGTLTSDIEVRWDPAAANDGVAVAGKLDVVDLRAAAAYWFGPDTLLLDQLVADARLVIHENRLQIDAATMRSELAELEIRGGMGWDTTAVEALLADKNYHAEGSVNIAKCAERLPRLLKLKDDTRVTSGEIALRLDSAIEDGARRWTGEITSSDLEGETGGRQISWKQPIEVTYRLVRLPNGQLGGDFTGGSEFLKIIGNGTATSATVSAAGDLGGLTASLRQFVDLGDVELAGRFSAAGNLRRKGDDFQSDGHLLLQESVFALEGRPPIRESRLTLAFEASGTAEKSRLIRIDAAKLRVLAGGDRLQAELTAAVNRLANDVQWPVAFSISGKLGSWLPRIRNWLPLQHWDIRGGVEATGNLAVAAKYIDLSDAKVQVTDFQVNGGGLAIAEPRGELAVSGSWDAENSVFRTSDATIASSAASARFDELMVELLAGKRPQLSGTAVVNADLSRLQTWIADWPTAVRLAGALNAQLRLSGANGIIRGDTAATIRQLAVSRPLRAERRGEILAVGQSQKWIKVWEEPITTFSGSAEYAAAADQLAISKFGFQSRLAGVTGVAGSIEQLTTGPLASLRGVLHYDLDVVNDLVALYTGDNVHLTGRGKREFAFRGPLTATIPDTAAETDHWIAKIVASAALDWDSIKAYGLTVGEGELAGTINDGLVQFSPLDLAFSGGRLRTTPMLHFPKDSPRLTLSKNSQIERARITPELCQSWLQYVAPLLASATRAEGIFSIELHNGDVPVTQPRDSNLTGDLTIHSAQVSPGPASRQIVAIAQQVDAILRRRAVQQSSAMLNITNQVIPFEVRDRRVHHRDFRIEVGDVELRSGGSVGLDSTLALIVEIPIRDRWVERDPGLRPLRGQTLKIPIRGTLSKPKVDNRVLKNLAKTIAGGTVTNLIDDALEKGLDSLFKGLKP